MRRVLQVALALVVGFAAFTVARGTSDGTAPVLPDTSVDFSLDHTVVGSADLDLVYAVEQRARPGYRIFSFDPRSGEDETIFTVPDDAIIYGLAVSPDRSTLAVAYTPDYAIEGSGLWTLDLESLSFAEISAPVSDVYLTELEYSADGRHVYATHVDRRGDREELAIAVVDLGSGRVDIVLDDAITPAVDGDNLHHLIVDADQGRRRIGVLDASGQVRSIEVADGALDLDHLVAANGKLGVAALIADEDPALTLGDEAEAHGNHNVASTWWSISGVLVEPTSIEPIVTYDAALTTDGMIVSATLEGLAVAVTERTQLIASRAIRFVAA